MQYKNEYYCNPLHFLLLLILLVFATTAIAGTTSSSAIQQKNKHRPPARMATSQGHQTPSAQGEARQPKEPVGSGKRLESETPDSEKRSKPSRDLKKESSTSSRDAKKQQAMSLLDDVLATTDRITPVDYRILTEVEGATLLWQFDKERSLPILKNVIKEMRSLMEQEKNSTAKDGAGDARRRLWFCALRKIAILKPELIQELSLGDSSGSKPQQSIKDEWTEEARALMSAASEKIESDPKVAARLAEQSLTFGTIDWVVFLDRLYRRDNSEAERLAITILDRAGHSSISTGLLHSMKRFAFAPGVSPAVRDHYFQSLSVRLRQDIRPDVSVPQLQALLYMAQDAAKWAAEFSPRWQSAFTGISFTLESIFNERSTPNPGPPAKKVIDVSQLGQAVPGDTMEIARELPRITAIKDSRVRDEEYHKLAGEAALKADVSLAMTMMLKIDNEDFRRETSLMVYSPFIRKAIKESDWSQAQKYALEILDPLGRTLAIETIAEEMLQSGQDKMIVKEVRVSTAGWLQRQSATVKVAKALLMLARSLHPIDPQAGLDIMNSAILVFNKLPTTGESLEGVPLTPALANWVRWTPDFLSEDERIGLVDMLENVFGDLARRDPGKAILAADGLTQPGLYSLARLAICKIMLEEVSNSPFAPQRRKAAIK